jgi:hypothetical protein
MAGEPGPGGKTLLGKVWAGAEVGPGAGDERGAGERGHRVDEDGTDLGIGLGAGAAGVAARWGGKRTGRLYCCGKYGCGAGGGGGVRKPGGCCHC